MGKQGEWVSGRLCIMGYKEILLQYVSLMVYFGSIGFVMFREGSIVFLTAETRQIK